MRGLAVSGIVLSSLALSGCVSTVTSVAKAPFKVVGKAADLATTSQSEADEKRGREIRKREEELGKLDPALRQRAERNAAKVTGARAMMPVTLMQRCRFCRAVCQSNRIKPQRVRNLSLMARPTPSLGMGATAILAASATQRLRAGNRRDVLPPRPNRPILKACNLLSILLKTDQEFVRPRVQSR